MEQNNSELRKEIKSLQSNIRNVKSECSEQVFRVQKLTSANKQLQEEFNLLESGTSQTQVKKQTKCLKGFTMRILQYQPEGSSPVGAGTVENRNCRAER